jgi:hypothetical protein
MPSKKVMFKRLFYSMLIGLLLGAAINEITFIFLRETARSPQEIILTIPAGTAEQVARGEQPPSIPNDMTFVVGDVLTVKNQDVVDHKLGQLWIPANTSASLSLDQEESLAFECSFQPTKYFGLDVKEPLTVGTRIGGILFSGLPMGILIAVYSMIMPVKKKEHALAQNV